jgi:signal transduction histidine kinase
MFHSIRWRLVASYLLLTLLTVSLVGILALSLVQNHVEQQQVEQLATNAEAIARQALPLMWPIPRESALIDLARTSAFLGNVRVKILNNNGQVYIDSGPAPDTNQMVMLAPPPTMPAPNPNQPAPFGMNFFPSLAQEMARFNNQGNPMFASNGAQQVTIVRRVEGPWGHQLVFETRSLPVSEAPNISPGMSGVKPGTGVSNAALPATPEAVSTPAESRSDRTITFPIGEPNGPIGYVQLSDGANYGHETVATFQRAFLWAAAVAGLIALSVGLVVSRSLTAPLRSLTAASTLMSQGDLSVRAKVIARDEIGQLARQFNQMAGRLEISFTELAAERDTLRRFVADASHELRTPIATLRNFNELLLTTAVNDPQAQAEFLEESQTQLKRLEWITQNLLNLSRLDAGLTPPQLAPCDAAEILGSIYSSARMRAEGKDIALSMRLPAEPVTLQCDRTQFEGVLANLLDNALKFTPPGGRIQLGAAKVRQRTQVWVQDTGIGISPADQARLFERFYRGTNAHHIQGSGLGLAIVQSIIQAHGGTVSVESQPGHGSRFVIDLPPKSTPELSAGLN